MKKNKNIELINKLKRKKINKNDLNNYTNFKKWWKRKKNKSFIKSENIKKIITMVKNRKYENDKNLEEFLQEIL